MRAASTSAASFQSDHLATKLKTAVQTKVYVFFSLTRRNFSDNSAKAALECLENVTAEQITHEIGFLVKATLE